jgi:4-amino-4-deoxychorismate lyase
MTQSHNNQAMIFINGEQCNVVSALDRGFNYGDGIFETIRVVNHKLTLWPYHRARLLNGAQRLKITFDIDLVENELAQACSVQAQSVIKLVITRGVGGRGYMPGNGMEASRIISVHELPTYPSVFYKEGIELHVCDTRIGSSPLLAGLKHLNRLDQVMASLEMMNSSCAEGLLLDEREYVIEGIRTNLFIMVDNMLITPDLSRSGIEGVMRQFILEEVAATHNIQYKIAIIDMDIIAQAHEIFVCNSVNGIWPVNKIGDLSFGVGNITKLLQESVHSVLQL